MKTARCCYTTTGPCARLVRCQQPVPHRSRLKRLSKEQRRYYFPDTYKLSTCLALRFSSTVLALDDDAIAFCLDSAIADLSYLTTIVAYHAAQELWPDRVVGPVGVYVDKARSILPALAEPHHAVVLVRLLADEGVIGARSTAGREGPVVGRAVRDTGSRPLLVAEIAEHWPVVMDSCLLRWSLNGLSQPQGSRDSSDTFVTESGGKGGALDRSNSNWSKSNNKTIAGVSRIISNRDKLLEQARLAFRAAQAALLEDPVAVEACLSRVTPYYTAVEALKGCSRSQLILFSTMPADLSLRVLSRCGLTAMETQKAEVLHTSCSGLDLICAPSWAGAVSRVVGRAAVCGNRVQLITGNLAQLEQLVEGFREEYEAGVREVASSVSRSQDPLQPPRPTYGPTAAAATTDSATELAAAVAAASASVAEDEVQKKGSEQREASASSPSSSLGAAVVAETATGSDFYVAECGMTSVGGSAGSSSDAAESAMPCWGSGIVRHATEAVPPSSGWVAGADVEPAASLDSHGAAATRMTPGVLSDGTTATAIGSKLQRRIRTAVEEVPLPISVMTATDAPRAAIESTADNTRWPSLPPAICSAADQGTGEASAATGAVTRCVPGDDECVSTTGQHRRGSSDACDSKEGYDHGGSGSWSPWLTLRRVHLAEWSCASVSFRARALSHHPHASLLSEHQLAQWLGVTHLDVVMDGVAWR